MVDSSATEMQKSFAAALKKKMDEMFSQQTNGAFETMSVPNGMYWGIQFGGNNYYNRNFLNQANLQAIRGSNGILTIGNDLFTQLYKDILGATVFAFSQSDEKANAQDNTNNQSQVQALINGWETDMGSPITKAQMDGAFPTTKLGYILGQYVSKWSSNPDNVPDAFPNFKPALLVYLAQAAISARLGTQAAALNERLKAARANSVAGTADNGGLPISANEYYLPLGPFPTQNKINSSLQTLTNKVSMNFKLENFSSNTSRLSIEGKTGFTIPILDFASIGVSGGAKYTVDKYASSSTVINTDITYEGITFVEAPLTDANLSGDNKKGWYWNDGLSDGIRNVWTSGSNPSKTGLALHSTQYPVDEYFGTGKKFSRIKTWILSQEPTIKMQFCGADASKIKTDFKQTSHVGVKLFGLIDVGSVDQSYQVTDVDDKSVAGCVTVTMGSTKTIGTTTSADARAYVVGGVPSYPPNNT
jgi:hypothetical protein